MRKENNRGLFKWAWLPESSTGIHNHVNVVDFDVICDDLTIPVKWVWSWVWLMIPLYSQASSLIEVEYPVLEVTGPGEHEGVVCVVHG